MYQNQTVWSHAWVVTYNALKPGIKASLCAKAIEEVDPNVGFDENWTCNGQHYYEDLRQLFTGIQVAGPRLTPSSMDQGFHAIPAVRSSNPQVPACYYDVNDYACTHDSV